MWGWFLHLLRDGNRNNDGGMWTTAEYQRELSVAMVMACRVIENFDIELTFNV